jgi:hypothetical protein
VLLGAADAVQPVVDSGGVGEVDQRAGPEADAGPTDTDNRPFSATWKYSDTVLYEPSSSRLRP